MVQCMVINRGYILWRLIYKVKYEDSYRGYNVWRLVLRALCLETHRKVTMYGYSYRG